MYSTSYCTKDTCRVLRLWGKKTPFTETRVGAFWSPPCALNTGFDEKHKKRSPGTGSARLHIFHNGIHVQYVHRQRVLVLSVKHEAQHEAGLEAMGGCLWPGGSHIKRNTPTPDDCARNG